MNIKGISEFHYIMINIIVRRVIYSEIVITISVLQIKDMLITANIIYSN